MIGSEPPPLHHLSDWGAWMWVITLTAAPVLYAIAGIALWFALTVDPYMSEIRRPMMAGAVAFASTIGALAVSSSVARHIANATPDRLWLLVPIVAAVAYAVVTAFCAQDSRRWFGWTMTGITAVGGVLIALNDALNRLAASIPMGFTALVTLLVVGTIGMLLYAFSSRQRV
jgi:hypothetical protein